MLITLNFSNKFSFSLLVLLFQEAINSNRVLRQKNQRQHESVLWSPYLSRPRIHLMF